MQKKSKYFEYRKSYYLFKEYFSSSLEIRKLILELEPQKREYFLRGVHLLHLAEKNKFLDISLSCFLLSSASETLGYVEFKKGPTANHAMFLGKYSSKVLREDLARRNKLIKYIHKTRETKLIRKIDYKEIIDIYYSIVRCMFTHQGKRTLTTMKKGIANCGTTQMIHPYKKRNKVSYELGTDSYKGYDIFIPLNFSYEKFKLIVFDAFVNFLKKSK